MEFHGEDDGSVSWMEDELKFVEKQHLLWMKDFEDEGRLRKQKYEEKLAAIDEAAARDTEDLEREYEARRKAIEGQFQSTVTHQYATDPQMTYFPSEAPLDTVFRLQDDELSSNNPSASTSSCGKPDKPPVAKVIPVVAVETTIVSSNEGFYCEVGDAISRSLNYSPVTNLPGEHQPSRLDFQHKSSTSVVLGSINENRILLLATEVSVLLPGDPTNISKLISNETADELKFRHSYGALYDVHVIDLRYDAKIQDAMFDDDAVGNSGGEVLLTTVLAVFDPGGK